MPIFVTNNSPEAGTDLEERVEANEPGAINYLNPGETISFATPPASTGFSEFTKTQHRAIANGYLMTYEMFTGDLSNVNFSSGRMGWLDFQHQVEDWQYLLLIPKFCDKVYAWFVEAAKIVVGLDSEIIISATWTAPRREMIDPSKEIAAQRLNVRSGFASWQEIVKQNGYNPEDVIKELIEDQERFDEAGLMPEWSPFFEKKVLLQMQQSKKASETN